MKLPTRYSELTSYQKRLVREEYIKRQDGNCMYCRQPLSGPPSDYAQGRELNLTLFPANFLDHPVHLQHDHFTGMTEGAVHAHCNGVLWQYHGR